jgi:glycosyltransferase involved in cell wall biosynthesis
VLQEIKKPRIVIASVLKPVDDTRAFEKMANTLAKQNVEVYLIGQPSKNKLSGNPSVHFLPVQKFDRLSFKRWLASIKIALKIYQVKPQVLIVNTHELLIVAVVYKILFGCVIIYDIQENYAQNILLTNAFPRLARWPLAQWVRLKEWVTAPFFQYFLLAEKCYENELPFIRKKYCVIENKVWLPNGFKRTSDPESIKIIFTGTLSETTGVFSAIELAKKLHQLEPKIVLEIVGFCAHRETLNKIKCSIEKDHFISIKGGNDLVPHNEIVNAIASANFGVISYQLLPYLKNKIPTKLYEYLGAQLPILLQKNEPWTSLADRFNACITIDFGSYNPKDILNKMRTKSCYGKNMESLESRVHWSSQEKKFIDTLIIYTKVN